MMSEQLASATVEWGGWRFELRGVDTHSDFNTHGHGTFDISGHVVSAEKIADDAVEMEDADD